MQVGDEVVIMSATGRFTVIAIEGWMLTIENAEGIRKVVAQASVRTVAKRPDTAR